MSEAEIPQSPTPSSEDALKTAGEFIKQLLSAKEIQDSISQQQISVPVDKVEIAANTTRDNDGVLKQSLHFRIEGAGASELNQAAILGATEATLAQVPILSQNFNLGQDGDATKPRPSVHNRHDTKTLDIKFDLPQGVEPAAVVKDILELAHGVDLGIKMAHAEQQKDPAVDVKVDAGDKSCINNTIVLNNNVTPIAAVENKPITEAVNEAPVVQMPVTEASPIVTTGSEAPVVQMHANDALKSKEITSLGNTSIERAENVKPMSLGLGATG